MAKKGEASRILSMLWVEKGHRNFLLSGSGSSNSIDVRTGNLESVEGKSHVGTEVQRRDGRDMSKGKRPTWCR